jgi:F-type H+-transporting ATPase subunit c
MITPIDLHYIAIIGAVVLSALGGGIGQGIAGLGGTSAIIRQKAGQNSIFRAMMLGLALAESGTILSLVVALLMMFSQPAETVTWGIAYAELGMGFAIGIASAAMGIASGFAVKAACESVGRQPYISQKIITLMLLVQSIIEAPVIFALLVALLIKTRIYDAMTIYEGIKLAGAGLAMGVGSIGPSIGQAIFVKSACEALGLNKDSYGKVLPFSLMSQAVIETPLIFSLIISALLIYKPVTQELAVTTACVSLAIAFVVGFGTGGAAVSSGYTASKSVKYVALDVTKYGLFLRTTLLGQAIIESSAIYSLIVGLILITKLM